MCVSNIKLKQCQLCPPLAVAPCMCLNTFLTPPLPPHMVFERFWVRPKCSPHTMFVIWFSTALPWCRGTRSCSNSPWPPSQTRGRHLDPVSSTCQSSPDPPRGLLIGNRRWTTQHKSQDPPLRPTPCCHFSLIVLGRHLEEAATAFMLIYINASTVSMQSHVWHCLHLWWLDGMTTLGTGSFLRDVYITSHVGLFVCVIACLQVVLEWSVW